MRLIKSSKNIKSGRKHSLDSRLAVCILAPFAMSTRQENATNDQRPDRAYSPGRFRPLLPAHGSVWPQNGFWNAILTTTILGVSLNLLRVLSVLVITSGCGPPT